ncbi:hypothetical protein DFJ73DRAFT_818637, partial [Zopfochytrium polystomum]
YSGHLEVVKLLLTKNADASAVNSDGERPLDVAKRCGHADIAEFLRDQFSLMSPIIVQDSALSPIDVLSSPANSGGGSSIVVSLDQLYGNPGSRRRGLFGLFRRSPK